MRGWHEAVATAGDLVPGGVPGLAFGLLLVTAIAAMLWYWWPDWLPERRGTGRAARRGRAGRRRRWFRWPRFRFRFGSWRLRWRWLRWRLGGWRLRWRRLRWRRRRIQPGGLAGPRLAAGDELPEVPAGELLLTADQLAAQGRFREAVRERLRAIVRDLVDRGVIDHRPGWTVTELAAAAGRAAPAVAAPLAAATELFSRIWYGQRPATASHDAAMREYASQLGAAVAGRPVPV
jgi:hypothetical protein